VFIWNKLLPPTDHPGGSFPKFTQQDFADIEAFLADTGSLGRPDGVPDLCQGASLPNCDFDGASDACELASGTQLDLNYDGIPDDCAPPVCTQPTVASAGSRYLHATPAASTGTVAIAVAGDPADEDVSCVFAYVQADGTLTAEPFYRSPTWWGTAKIHDAAIIPGASFVLQTDCRFDTSAAQSVETLPFGETNGVGPVDLDDILCVLAAFSENYGLCALEATDLAPCTPDGVVDLDDILLVLSAFSGEPEPCAVPCSK
jgi:hypothetical protein